MVVPYRGLGGLKWVVLPWLKRWVFCVFKRERSQKRVAGDVDLWVVGVVVVVICGEEGLMVASNVDLWVVGVVVVVV